MHATSHAIVHGNAHLSQCSCGAQVASTPGDIELHMYPITAAEWATINDETGEEE